MKIFRIIAVILLISFMVIIFCFSSQTAKESSGTSGRVITAIISVFYPDLEDMSEEERSEFIKPFQFIVRKGAHFTLFAVLGLLAFFAVITYKQIDLKYRYIISAGICLFYAVFDEVHQAFVPGRSCELRDMVIDFSGAALMILFLILLFKLKIFKKIKAVLF